MQRDMLFQNPDIYDFIFRYEVSSEISILRNHAKLSENTKVLLPACGTGRYAQALSDEVLNITAFDLEKNMIQYAQDNRGAENIQYTVGNMTWYTCNLTPDSFDAAMLLNNSLRYILSREQAIQHMQAMNLALKNGARYILELGINEDLDQIGNKIEWSATSEKYQVAVQWTLQDIENEILTDEINMEILSDEVHENIILSQKQLRWTASQLKNLAQETGFHIVKWLDRLGNTLNDDELLLPRRIYLVLQKGISNAS